MGKQQHSATLLIRREDSFYTSNTRNAILLTTFVVFTGTESYRGFQTAEPEQAHTHTTANNDGYNGYPKRRAYQQETLHTNAKS
jgi:hypothetical protein